MFQKYLTIILEHKQYLVCIHVEYNVNRNENHMTFSTEKCKIKLTMHQAYAFR